jgi:uncharacterized protein YjbI with pentapeptide repeats
MFTLRKAITITAILFASSASAFDPDDLEKLNETDSYSECNLTGANLRNANLSGADLTNANISGAYLTGSNLSGADLTNANISGAMMNDVILCNTIMPDGSVLFSGC